MKSQVRKSRLLACALLLAPAAIIPGCGDDDGNDGPRADGGGPDGSAPDGGNIDGGGGMDGGGPDGTVPGGGDGGTDAQVGPDSAVIGGGDTWVYTDTNKLLHIERATGRIVETVTAQVPATETVLGVDRRPKDGAIHALTSAGKLYTVNPSSGAFTNPQTLSVALTQGATGYGVDFNPAVDRLRIINSAGQNLRVNVDTGETTADTALAPTPAVVAAAAYTNNWPRATTPSPVPACATSLFVIDATNTKLLLQNPPNAGTLNEVGALTGITAGQTIAAFDIVTSSTGGNVGLLATTGTAGESLYQLDLSTSAATFLSTIPAGEGKIIAVLGTPLTTELPEKLLGELVATTEGNRVITFNRATPGVLCSDRPITGLVPAVAPAIDDEIIVGGDVRPSDKALYILTKKGSGAINGKVRKLDAATGVLDVGVALVATDAAPTDDDPYTGLEGIYFGVDFNPVVDLLRVVSSTGQNLRIAIDATSAKVRTDTDITPGNTAVTEVAYANPNGISQATTGAPTVLYAIEAANNQLGTIGDIPALTTPNDGVFKNAVPLGVQIFAASGGDIEPVTNDALIAVSVGTDDTSARANTVLYRANAAAVPPATVLVSLGKIGAGTDPVSSLSFTLKP